MKKAAYLLAVLAFAVSCGENIEEKAGVHLENARTAFKGGNFNLAKQEIDSIRILYPKAFESRRQALELMQKVEEAEQIRSIAYEDSIISSAAAAFESMKDNFVYEKDERYQDIGIFTVRSQAVTRNVSRNYLRGQVDEQGHMTLVSNWTGKSYVHHDRLRLESGGTFVETPACGDRHEFTDLGIAYERCSFTHGKDGGAAAFIAANRNSRIEVSQIAEKYSFRMVMMESDRQAIAQLYDLSQVLLTLYEHQNIRQEAERRLQFVRNRMQAGSEEQAVQQN